MTIDDGVDLTYRQRRRRALAIVLFVAGSAMLFWGIFGFWRGSGAPTILILIGVTLLVLATIGLLGLGWHGSVVAWPIGAVAIGILTWFGYEVLRQSPLRPEIGVLGTMTAPVLSATVAAAVLAIGAWRRRRGTMA